MSLTLAPKQETPPAQPEARPLTPSEKEAFLEQIEKPKTKEIIQELGDFPYCYSSIFYKTSGFGARGLAKKKVALIKQIEPTFTALLFKGEEIQFVTKGIYTSWIEQYFLGWLSYTINQTVFVFTNLRVVMMNANGRGQPLHMKWHVPYDQIKKFKTGWVSSSMQFKLVDKKTFSFSRIPAHDRKPLKALVKESITQANDLKANMPCYSSRDYLCTNCFLPVPKNQYVCEHCKEEFIVPKKPALMSLALPCLGDFCLGHRLLGSMELIGYLLVWVGLVLLWFEEGTAILPAVAIILFMEHALDAALTLHMAKKGLVSKKYAWKSHTPETTLPAQ